jgi:hypothetical protein
MAPKESLDRALMTRLRTQFQTTDADSLLRTASDDLLAFIRNVPLVYGFWGDFKRLVKAAERATATEFIAALLARLDTTDLPRHAPRVPDAPQQDRLHGVGRMEFDGAFAYVLCTGWRSQGVSIVDMTLPALPAITAHIDLPNLLDVAISGTKMVLLQSGSWGRLSCYDISDRQRPKPETSIEMANGVRVAVSGTLIAVVSPQGRRPGLQLFDASLPGRLQPSGYLALYHAAAIQIVDRTAYIVTEAERGGKESRLTVVDLSDPLQPRKVKEIPIPPTGDLVVQGRYAYLTCTEDSSSHPNTQPGLAVVDLAPTGLAIFGGARRIALLPLGRAVSLAVQGRYAYVSIARAQTDAKQTGGLRIVDISDPSHPQLVGSFQADEARAVKVSGEVLCACLEIGWDNGFQPMHVGEPSRPLLLGAAPSRETLDYMKRRGRRLLRNLALRDPETYVKTAVQMLLETAKFSPALDTKLQWISMDLLYGGGTRYEQQAHGRGSYGAPRAGLSLRTRQERFPELWDRYPESAEQLYTTPKLPWETWEAACKMLRDAKRPLPALSDKMLAGFLTSESPLLRSIAGRQIVATLEAGRTVAADIVADTYFGGTRRQREVIGQYLIQQQNNARWATAFATRLYRRASFVVVEISLPHKAMLSFALLISLFPTLFHRDILPKTVAALFNTHRSDFIAWTLEVLRNVLPMQLAEWLTALESLSTETRETAVQAVLAGFETKEIPQKKAGELVQHPSAWIRQTAWRILAHSQTPLADIAPVWLGLLDSTEPTPALLTAFDSPHALALFTRCEFDSQLMADRLERHSFLTTLLPMNALEKIVAVLDPASTVQMVAETSSVQWPELRTALLRIPLLLNRRGEFWRAAFAAISATGNENLIHRLLNDETMQADFLHLVDISEFLHSANPVFGPLLGQWIAAHLDHLSRDSAELLQIATHPLPEVRGVGLEQVRKMGMSLPFALRMLESELPPSVALGKTFFEAIEPGDSQRAEAITALCDSPKPSVRAYGREVLTARPDMLADTDIWERLSENPDTETQAFVAGQLLAQPTTAGRASAFDRAVLRARDRGRRAKELVKARLDTQPTPDVSLLLEMARSRTPRDADWALGQLAKLALEGVEIPGFTLDGVAGG